MNMHLKQLAKLLSFLAYTPDDDDVGSRVELDFKGTLRAAEPEGFQKLQRVRQGCRRAVGHLKVT